LEKEVYVELNNLSKTFHSIKAVDNLTLKVYRGDIYGFLGPNGAGKSTTIRMILSLIKPTSGSIKLFGQDFTTNRYKTLNRIGALIEKPDFYKYLSAYKNLEILGELSNVKDLDTKIMDVLELVGLTERANSRIKTYSQGMRQRLGIAQSLLHNPDLIILDEPSNGLDPQGQKEIRTLIQSINNEKGITFVISSHILTEIEQIANRMVIINHGKVVVEGEVDKLLNSYGMNVRFEVENTPKALEIIKNSEWVNKLEEVSNNKLSFRLEHDEIPLLNLFFVQNKLKIFTVDPMRSLEDYFISITGDE